MNNQQILSERRKERRKRRILKQARESIITRIMREKTIKKNIMAEEGSRKIIEGILIPIFSEMKKKFPDTDNLIVKIQYCTGKKEILLETTPQIFDGTQVYKNPTPKLKLEEVMSAVYWNISSYGFQIKYELRRSYSDTLLISEQKPAV